MLIASDAQIAPFFYRDGEPQPLNHASARQLCASWTIMAEANARLCQKIGFFPHRKTPVAPYSAAELMALKDLVYDTPFARLLERVDAIDPKRKAAIIDEIEADLKARTGSDISLTQEALPFVWRSSSCFLIIKDRDTWEDCIVFNVRSHRTAYPIGRLQPSGSGYTAGKDVIVVETAPGTAGRELWEESGVATQDIVALGYAMRDIPMKLHPLPAQGDLKVPGVMTEFTFVGYHRLPYAGLESVTLNSESFGGLSCNYTELAALARGKNVKASFYPSLAPFAQRFVGDIREKADAAGMPLTLSMLAEHAEETGLLAKKDSRQTGTLDLGDPISVQIGPADFMMGKWNGIAMGMQALQHAGYKATAAERAYVRQHSCIDRAATAGGLPALTALLPSVVNNRLGKYGR